MNFGILTLMQYEKKSLKNTEMRPFGSIAKGNVLALSAILGLLQTRRACLEVETLRFRSIRK